MRATLAVVAAGLLGACSSGRVDTPETVDLESQLAQGVATYAYEGGNVAITGRRWNQPRGERVDLGIVDATGHAALDPDDVLWIDALSFALPDVIVWPGNVPLQLTQIKVDLIEPVGAIPDVDAADEGSLAISLPVRLRLSWAVRTASGEIVRLAPQELAPLSMLARFEQNQVGHVVGHLQLSAKGEIWRWAALLYLEDPIVHVDMTDHPRAPAVE
jgi:hypothetical protein